jgi:hypothetical protein
MIQGQQRHCSHQMEVVLNWYLALDLDEVDFYVLDHREMSESEMVTVMEQLPPTRWEMNLCLHLRFHHQVEFDLLPHKGVRMVQPNSSSRAEESCWLLSSWTS